MNDIQKQVLIRAYENFNNRNIDGVLETMTPDIHWPNGWEGGYVNGYEEVRDYWTRQWKELNPVVTPVEFEVIDQNVMAVHVHQLVKDHNGTVLFDGIVDHIYTFEDGLVKAMEIKKAE